MKTSCVKRMPSENPRLPCITFTSIGSCPYKQRCVFLHDPRLQSSCDVTLKHYKKKSNNNGEDLCHNAMSTSRKNTVDRTLDIFFFPQKSGTDSWNMEKYDVSYSDDVMTPWKFTKKAEYSLWNHFVEFLSSDKSYDCAGIYNSYTGKRRLPIFVELSKGRDVATSFIILQDSKNVNNIQFAMSYNDTGRNYSLFNGHRR